MSDLGNIRDGLMGALAELPGWTPLERPRRLAEVWTPPAAVLGGPAIQRDVTLGGMEIITWPLHLVVAFANELDDVVDLPEHLPHVVAALLATGSEERGPGAWSVEAIPSIEFSDAMQIDGAPDVYRGATAAVTVHLIPS